MAQPSDCQSQCHQANHQQHSHALNSTSELGKKNESHFDNVATTIFNTPWIQELCNQIVNELHEQIEWIGVRKPSDDTNDSTRMLDYACGNGTASRAFAPYISNIRGIDISSGMVKEYNRLAREEGHSEQKMHAVHGDILGPIETSTIDLSTADFSDFDLVVLSMALHHVEDPQNLVTALSQRLRKGGVLLIVDWVSPEESNCEVPKPKGDSAVKHTVSRQGFRKNDLRVYMENAALDPDWRWFSSRSKLPEDFGGENQLFLAKGSKL